MKIAPQWGNRQSLSQSRDSKDVRRMRTGFQPIDLDSLSVWLAADDLSDRLSDTDTVGYWPDRSERGVGVGRWQSGTSATFQTDEVNGRPAVEIANGSADGLVTRGRLVTAGGTPTIFVVLKPSGTASQNLLQFGDSSTDGERITITPEVGIRVGGGNRLFDTAASTGSYNLITARFNGANANQTQAWLDGTELGASSTSAQAISTDIGLTIGAGYNDSTSALFDSAGTMQIAELVVFDESLSDGMRSAVEGYLNRKYKLF